uniref:Secreted protein n=1 Tax=Arundo donax TaxID=35708 RepID=A0A0A9DQU4_ARUDO
MWRKLLSSVSGLHWWMQTLKFLLHGYCMTTAAPGKGSDATKTAHEFQNSTFSVSMIPKHRLPLQVNAAGILI